MSITIDGAARPNPGVRAVGVVIRFADGREHHLSRRLVGLGCGNSAELAAVVVALSAVADSGADAATVIDVVTDSRVAVELLCERPPDAAVAGSVKAARDDALAALQAFPHARLRWRPRRHTQLADALARAALDTL